MYNLGIRHYTPIKTSHMCECVTDLNILCSLVFPVNSPRMPTLRDFDLLYNTYKCYVGSCPKTNLVFIVH